MARQGPAMRGYFGIGAERISKQMNVGSLFRTAHAFGAGFVFTVAASYARDEGEIADTSRSTDSVPHYDFETVRDLRLPVGCRLIGVEITDDAIELPSFRHPRCAAYVLGQERGSLSPDLVGLCDHVVKIPTKFAVNLAIAGAIVMYDRLISTGRFAARPLVPGGPAEPLPPHVFGEPLWKKKQRTANNDREER
jgi:tRNA G18 (ribose-2'-O)-methylase SpoU